MRRVIGLSLVIALMLAASAESASAVTPMPSDATLTIDGHGWGHARGMGQWGARGKAEAGKTYTQILASYFSGTATATRASEDIRVLVEESQDVVVTSQETFTVSWETGGVAATSDGTYKFLRARRNSSGYNVERSTSHTGPWAVVTSGTSNLVFSPSGSGLLELVFDSGKVRLYRGSIIARVGGSDNLMRSINQLLLEQYVNAVVPSEMPSSWPAEALKAQAVAARTYAVNKKLAARANGTMFDICATTSCQVYGGFGWRSEPGGTLNREETTATAAAISATAGKVLTYGGSPILAEYSSSTGGYTAAGSVPYEKPVPDPEDAISTHHDWQASVRVSDIEAQWPSIGRLVSATVTKRNGYGEWGGRVTELRLVGSAAAVTVSGGAFRSAFDWPAHPAGLQSDWFRIRESLPGVIGVHRDGVWFLRTNSSTISFSFGRSTDVPVTGDWDGNGTETAGVVRGNVWYLDNNNDGHADVSLAFGRSTDKPVVGDWDGNGTQTPGVVRGDIWYLDNNNDGHADLSLAFGRSTDIPVVGDWDGNGTDSPGVVRGNLWYLDNNRDGRADLTFPYGRSTDTPIAGDWDGSGTDTPGVFRSGFWYLDNGNDGSGADVSFAYGRSTDSPITGDWAGVSS